MSDETRDDIRATSDDIEADAVRLADLERQKQDPNASDSELKRLAAQAEDLARRMADKARIEKKLVDETAKS